LLWAQLAVLPNDSPHLKKSSKSGNNARPTNGRDTMKAHIKNTKGTIICSQGFKGGAIQFDFVTWQQACEYKELPSFLCKRCVAAFQKIKNRN
jgi:hypothetical protein